MMPLCGARLSGVGAIALLSGVVALKEHMVEEHLIDNAVGTKDLDYASLEAGTEISSEAGTEIPDLRWAQPKGLHKQRLDNAGDVQYWGNMTFGEGTNQQKLRGLLDTGSFELLAFSQRCIGCFKAGKFEPSQSKTLKMGKRSQTHSYGSGSCTALDAFDRVSFSRSLSSPRQAMWIASLCSMPVLSTAEFNAIVGVGPPGQPVMSAGQRLLDAQKREMEFKKKNLPVPLDILQEKMQAKDDLKAARGKTDLLASLGVRTFSTCLGKQEGSPGWWIWNDKVRTSTPGVLEMPVAGNQTWTSKLQKVSMGKDVFGCSTNCAALVDTGTSLFAFPTPMYDKLWHLVSKSKGKCSDLRTFPDLHMTLGGQQLSFPPSSYIGRYYGQFSKEVAKFIHTDGKSIGSDSSTGPKCELLVMDLGEPQLTKMGDLVILGMPFFREYYTTFHLGKTRKERAMFASKADRGCGPGWGEVAAAEHKTSNEDAAFTPRNLDASKLRVPQWVGSLKEL